MSMSVNIKGVREHRNSKLSDMVDLKLLCDKLKIEYPDDLKLFFRNDEDILDSSSRDYILQEAREVDLVDIDPDIVIGDVLYGNGAIINLDKLPSDIKQLRIYTY